MVNVSGASFVLERGGVRFWRFLARSFLVDFASCGLLILGTSWIGHLLRGTLYEQFSQVC